MIKIYKPHLDKLHIMIKRPNPLNVFDIRKFKTPAPHLEYINLRMSYNLETAIDKWIKENCKGRYYIGKTVTLNKENVLDPRLLKIGFENTKELSYFTLACPLLKYH